MVESGELIRWESKRLEEDPEMSALGVRLMLLEVERRVVAKRDARLSLSSHMA
jgi:hypothetical protein